MKPIVFGGRFGWLHTGTSARGVVLCNTYGHESVWTYNGMRHLAEELSARGIWVLRFDYLGTGDSAGMDAAPDQFESAVIDIGEAVDWLKSETGIEHVTLCGFRVGAAFALAAALKRPVDDLVLLAPVTSGRTYLRELSVVRKTWLEQLAPPLRDAQPQQGPLNVLGQVYGDEFKRALEAVDMAASLKRATIAPARRALIMQARVSANDPLRDAFDDLHVRADTQPFDNLTGFIQETAFSVLPAKTYADAILWMSTGRARIIDTRATQQATANQWTDGLTIKTSESVERPVSIGEEGLFGILCEPRINTARSSIYLLTNTSASSHVGDSRLSVRIARELARRGVASLRFDARGRGDSAPEPGITREGQPFSNIYHPTATHDTAAAARWLSQQGYKSIFAFGICSGAYHALKAALIETAINGVIAVNIPVFKKPEDKAPGAPRQGARNSMAGYAISMFDPAKWKTVLKGEKKLLPMVRFVASNLATRVGSRVVYTLRLDSFSRPSSDNAIAPMPMIRALEAKGVKTVLVYGAYDGSMDLLAAHFGKRGARLERFKSVQVAIYDDVDHALFNPASSAKVISLCDEIIKGTSVPMESEAVPQQDAPVAL